MGDPRHTGRYVAAALRVAFAHHPLCRHFREDVFVVGPLRLCRGCSLTVPTFLTGLAASLVLLHLDVSPAALAAVGLALGLPQLATYRHRFGARTRALAKGTGGIGLALLMVALLGSGLTGWMLATLLSGLALVFVALQLVRVRGMLGTCRRCPWNMDWDRCPGFGGI